MLRSKMLFWEAHGLLRAYRRPLGEWRHSVTLPRSPDGGSVPLRWIGPV